MEVARRRSQRQTRLLANVFLGFAVLIFTVGLAIVGIAYVARFGFELPLEELGLLGELAASIEPPTGGTSDGSVPGPRSAPQLPSPLPSPTDSPTPTPSQTPTPTDTPLPSNTPTASLTPSQTPIPSATPLPSATPNETERAAFTSTPSPPPEPTGFPDCDPSGKSSFESAVIELINQQREANGLPPYDSSNRLRDAARAHSTDMACNGFFSHTGSNGSSIGDRVFMENYAWTAVAENIFGSGDTSDAAPQLAVDFWMAGSANQANLLSEEFTEIGVGYIHEPDSPFGGYFTAVFADR